MPRRKTVKISHISHFHRVADLTTSAEVNATCPLCPDFELRPGRVEKHLSKHTSGAVKVSDTFICPCFTKGCVPNTNNRHAHYHCLCGMVIQRKPRFKGHLKTCPVQTKSQPFQFSELTDRSTERANSLSTDPGHDSTEDITESSAPTSSVALKLQSCSSSKTTVCQLCNKSVSKKNVRRHLRTHSKEKLFRISQTVYHRGVIVDPKTGVYLVSKSLRGPDSPIHVQVQISASRQRIDCEHDACREKTAMYGRSGISTFQCPHVASVAFAQHQKEKTLDTVFLERLVDNKMIKTETMEKWLEKQRHAQMLGTPVVVLWEQLNQTDKLYFSVYHGQGSEIRYWCRFGRTVVTYNRAECSLKCSCSASKHSCVHVSLCKWYLAQHVRECSIAREAYPDTDSLLEDEHPNCDDNLNNTSHATSSRKEKITQMVSYVLKTKRIPVNFMSAEDPLELTRLSPIETNCTWCNGSLSTCTKTSAARIYGIGRVKEGLTLDVKVCTTCQQTFRYQEYTDGVVNYDDHTLLTLDLCRFLRSSIKNYTAISRAGSILSDAFGVTYPRDLLNAYLYFEALCDHNYGYYCSICGYYPPVIITDGNRKAAFRFNYDSLARAKSTRETINPDIFWRRVEMDIVSRGFTKEKLFEITPDYDQWAMWMGPRCRKEEVYNTEGKKVSGGSVADGDPDDGIELSEERLIEMLNESKVVELRKACRRCKISTKGNRLELLHRLRHEITSPGSLLKIYPAIRGVSGGWVSASCPHGVTYAMKSLVRPESVRDHVDVLLSFKVQPTVLLCDMASKVAEHSKIRCEQLVFHPDEGRAAPNTAENIKMAKDGTLDVDKPFLCLTLSPKASDNPSAHPVTGVSDKLCLYDWFHEKNTKIQKEILRRVSLVRQLRGIINTQTEEQLHGRVKHNIYFLDCMMPCNYLFVMRLVLGLWNEEQNDKSKAILEQQEYGVQQEELGRLVLRTATDNDPVISDGVINTDRGPGFDDNPTVEVIPRAEAQSDHHTTFELLKRNVAEAGLKFCAPTPEDGNCFFHALSDQLRRLNQPEKSHSALRQMVVQFLEDNHTLCQEYYIDAINKEEHISWDHYLEAMKKDGTWADHIILDATARMTGHAIVVVTSSRMGQSLDRNLTVIDPCTNQESSPSILLGHYHEAHYQSLDLQQGLHSDFGGCTQEEEREQTNDLTESVYQLRKNPKKEISCLPDEVLEQIFAFVCGGEDHVAVCLSKVCRKWFHLTTGNQRWMANLYKYRLIKGLLDSLIDPPKSNHLDLPQFPVPQQLDTEEIQREIEDSYKTCPDYEQKESEVVIPLFKSPLTCAFAYGLFLKAVYIPSDRTNQFFLMTDDMMDFFLRWRDVQLEGARRYMYCTSLLWTWLYESETDVSTRRVKNIVCLFPDEANEFASWVTMNTPVPV